MQLIKPSVVQIKESDPFKKIERVGRTCYKSEDKITEDSARKFYRGLVNRQHTAMVEHATFVFQIHDGRVYFDLASHANPFLHYTDVKGRYLVSGNLRALNESEEIDLLYALYCIDEELVYNKDYVPLLMNYFPLCAITPVDITKLKDVTKEEFNAHAYFTFLFTTDRGVSHEMVRHRPASYAQESTRYCNYVKEQFGGELTFIEPTGWNDLPDTVKNCYISSWDSVEDDYMCLIDHGQTPQQARAVLPNALKTEIIMTACAGEFEHFFDLRSRGTTGAPHPDIKTVADMALTLYEVEKLSILGE